MVKAMAPATESSSQAHRGGAGLVSRDCMNRTSQTAKTPRP